MLNKTFTGNQVPKTTKWLYVTSGLFREAAFQFIAMFLLIFAQYCGIGKTDNPVEYAAMYGVLTLIIVILKIWDGANDPIMGYFLEKSTKLRKFGKYRPWIFLGCVLSSIVALLMFWLPIHGWLYVVMFGILYFLYDLTFSMNDVAFWGLLPALSNDEKVRASLTSLISVFVSLGALLTGFLAPVLAKLFGYAISYRVFSLVASVLFVASQVILCVFMKEKKEETEQVEISQKMRFRDVFGVLLKNDQLRVAIISIIFYFIGSSVIMGLALNYFYFNFGYSTAYKYEMIFLAVCSVAILAAEVLYQVVMKKLKFTKKNALIFSSIIIIIFYLGMFFLFLKNPEEVFWLFCIMGFVIFYFQTTIQVVLYINVQDCIDYNEYKFGERREASIFSLRSFSNKIAGAVQQLIVFGVLSISGLLTISNQISGFENDAISMFGQDTERISAYVAEHADALTGAENIVEWQRIVLQGGFCLIPLICFLICVILMGCFYKISEKKHEEIVTELNKRHEEIADK